MMILGSQVLLTVAVPRALLMVAALGLQVVMMPLEGVPVATRIGVVSAVHVAVRVTVLVLPQASVAVHVRVWDLVQLPVTALSE